MKHDIILVDDDDQPIGTASKLEVHQNGWLHRAFSIFLFNNKGELLLQQRAHDKYHSSGLWTNTCCSHPCPGELTELAAVRRLNEEMGIVTTLEYAFSIKYFVSFDNGLIENEFDHVFIGTSDSLPQINKNEVASWKYISIAELKTDIKKNPFFYTEWFKILVGKISEKVIL
jgi:isopentenyl-diphosphate delta-isomerase